MITDDTTPQRRRRALVHRMRIDAIVRAFLHENDIPADDFISAQLTGRIFAYLTCHERRGRGQSPHGSKE